MVWIRIASFGRGGRGGMGQRTGWWMGCKTNMEFCVFCLSSFPTFLSFLTCDFYSNDSDINAILNCRLDP